MNNQREIDRYETMERAIDEEIEQAQKTLDYTESEEDYKKMQLLWQKQEDIRELKEKYIAETLTIPAMQSYYFQSNDKRIFDVVDVLKQVYDFFEENTNIPREKIINTIENTIFSIDIEDEEKGRVAYYNPERKELSLTPSSIYDGYLKSTLQHEFTHVLGTKKIGKNMVISGYSKYPSLEVSNKLEKINNNPLIKFVRKLFHKKESVNYQKDGINREFTEACVDTFACQYDEYKEYKLGNIQLYTNLKSSYRYNANLVKQMLLARGIPQKEMFDGLFDYTQAKKLIKKFDKKVFKALSSGMDKNSELFNKHYDIGSDVDIKLDELGVSNETSDEDYEKIVGSNADLKELLQNYNKTWNLMEQNISTMEKMIIDKILLPRLSKINEDEKRNLLAEYSKFLMFSKDYLQEKTGIKIMNDNPNNERDSFIQALQVAPNLSKDKSKTKETLNENIHVIEDTEIHIVPKKDDENCL